jgi:hypothetical protein
VRRPQRDGDAFHEAVFGIWVAAGWPRTAPLRRAMRWDGVYLMTQNQATNQRISPDDVRAVAALAIAERAVDAPFEICVNANARGAISTWIERGPARDPDSAELASGDHPAKSLSRPVSAGC